MRARHTWKKKGEWDDVYQTVASFVEKKPDHCQCVEGHRSFFFFGHECDSSFPHGPVVFFVVHVDVARLVNVLGVPSRKPLQPSFERGEPGRGESRASDTGGDAGYSRSTNSVKGVGVWVLGGASHGAREKE